MKKKTVIFVGGSSFSGSTILDMMIASGKNGISIGEVHALFYPYRKKHVTPNCGCGDNDCKIWHGIKEKKPAFLYQTLFERFPDAEFIVDSSKDPLWIQRQSKAVQSQGLDVKNVLIWKRPQGFALSQFKRGHHKRWERDWINYYRLYFAIIDDFVSINYEKLVKDPKQMLNIVCERIGLDYFEGKELYWNFKHHTLYGNNSAKVHLYSEKSDSYNKVSDELKKLNPSYLGKKHQKIYYDPNLKSKLPDHVHKQIETDQKIKLIEQLLNLTDQQSFSEDKNKSEIRRIKDQIQFTGYSILLREIASKTKRLKNYCMIEKLGGL